MFIVFLFSIKPDENELLYAEIEITSIIEYAGIERICSNLKIVVIPDSVTMIGLRDF